MKSRLLRHARSQDGFTLIELIVVSVITLLVMTGLTSVVLTSVRAGNIATGRIEASSQIRDFELRAYDDFARSGLPLPDKCAGTKDNPCTTQPITLVGKQVLNVDVPAPCSYDYKVTYIWDGAAFLDRSVAGDLSGLCSNPIPSSPSPPPASHLATGVSAFSWYLDGMPPNQTVVVSLTVTSPWPQPQPPPQSYSESQTFRFFPRISP